LAPDDPPRAFSRAELERLASGPLSAVLGPRFAPLDEAAVLVRLPMPPLLLVDRVTAIDAEPGVLGSGTIQTETDVTEGAWYLHQGRMATGPMVEAGQADLLLISWMGIDFHLRGERVYRLLGFELTFHGPPAQPGETLCFRIRIEGHARHGDRRLLFFRYDGFVNGELRLTVRAGQAGFFTRAELAGSQGVLWDAAAARCDAAARLDPPQVPACKPSLTRAELELFAAGDAFGCFGPGYEAAACHHRTPSIQGGDLLLLDRVTDLDPAGGPWGRGYLRAEKDLHPDDWFFPPHFKDDPCMPGTLMFEGGVQALSVYMAGLGLTLDRDGWRFEPVPGHGMPMRCRAQATPESRQLIYELFIESVSSGETPAVTADLLCSVDGVKAFHCRGLALRLVRDWPLEACAAELAALAESRPSAAAPGVSGGYASLLACAWGRLSSAFGPNYAPLDNSETVVRLPGPPYLCMSRITAMPPEPGKMETGASVEAAFDVDPAAWYFDDHGRRVMPHCVLLEAALQPCGWLTTYMGCPLTSGGTTRFRNLEGKGTVLGEVYPDGGCLTTRGTVTRLSRVGATILIGCEAECRQGERIVYRLETLLGFFPPAALSGPGGLPPDPAAEALFARPAEAIMSINGSSRSRLPATGSGVQHTGRKPGAGSPELGMLDRITGLWPAGGRNGLGALRAETDVDPRAWYFKAHFYQDPVQPGSLGLEAMLQLVQVHMLQAGMHRSVREPCFQVIAEPMEWKYRGQVFPTDRRITVTAEIVQAGVDDRGPYVVADASLWVDGRRIQEARGLGMRIISEAGMVVRELTFDPAQHAWVKDHCPTYVIPTMPLMGMADMLAEAASSCRPGWVVTELRDLQADAWLVCDRPRRLRVELQEVPLPVTEEGLEEQPAAEVHGRRAAFAARLLSLDDGEPRGRRIAEGVVILGEEWPMPPLPPEPVAGEEQPDPYREERIFHGPAFRYLRSLRVGPAGSSALLEPSAGWVEQGILGPGLLDAATHGIPGESLQQWCADLGPDVVAYPRRLRRLRIYGPAPEQCRVWAEARWHGLLPVKRPLIAVDVAAGDRLWASLLLEFVCLPKGPLGRIAPARRAAFLRDRQFVEGVALSQREGTATVLHRHVIAMSDWLPGTMAAVYAADPAGDLCRQVAVKEHVARAWQLHPSAVRWQDGSTAAVLPSGRHPIRVRDEGRRVVVEDDREAP
jgi:3-hydroxymyristoyl/3-hydroxydecanoyl-(acyl carrier protein) dehydratase